MNDTPNVPEQGSSSAGLAYLKVKRSHGNEAHKRKPEAAVIEFFDGLGFKYKVVTDSIYTDKRDVPVHYFQSDDADGFKLCSTIMADDATRLYNRIGPLGSFGFHCATGKHLISEKDCKQCKKEKNRDQQR